MRNFLLGVVIIVGGLLAGCGNDEEVVKEVEQTESKEPAEPAESMQADKDAELKENAVEADFVELNVDTPPLGKEVFLTGEVTFTGESDLGPICSITTEESDGSGMYTVFTPSGMVEIGKTYRVYGSVLGGKADDGTPQIVADIIEEAK
ncbi:hypothetical protein [Bacillus sp. ISL-57]|uniref:hypothetical protein n=1 Tax=Bacillus sp. ISL-57 TaxID=2819135 RepID=UPI001BE768BD|nr:hypothetical protein [Bacillus sp. ISL-57]MBT2714714.1 hypothetical protein [Bacillus sp. ISL-57]